MNIMNANWTVSIFCISPESCYPFSASLQTFCLTVRVLEYAKIRTVLQSIYNVRFKKLEIQKFMCQKKKNNLKTYEIKMDCMLV